MRRKKGSANHPSLPSQYGALTLRGKREENANMAASNFDSSLQGKFKGNLDLSPNMKQSAVHICLYIALQRLGFSLFQSDTYVQL